MPNIAPFWDSGEVPNLSPHIFLENTGFMVNTGLAGGMLLFSTIGKEVAVELIVFSLSFDGEELELDAAIAAADEDDVDDDISTLYLQRCGERRSANSTASYYSLYQTNNQPTICLVYSILSPIQFYS